MLENIPFNDGGCAWCIVQKHDYSSAFALHFIVQLAENACHDISAHPSFVVIKIMCTTWTGDVW